MLLDNGIRAPYKVLKAYMNEAGWPTEPTQDRKAQPLWALVQLGSMVA